MRGDAYSAFNVVKWVRHISLEVAKKRDLELKEAVLSCKRWRKTQVSCGEHERAARTKKKKERRLERRSTNKKYSHPVPLPAALAEVLTRASVVPVLGQVIIETGQKGPMDLARTQSVVGGHISEFVVGAHAECASSAAVPAIEEVKHGLCLLVVELQHGES
jgi:hypothetical protein